VRASHWPSILVMPSRVVGDEELGPIDLILVVVRAAVAVDRIGVAPYDPRENVRVALLRNFHEPGFEVRQLRRAPCPYTPWQ